MTDGRRLDVVPAIPTPFAADGAPDPHRLAEAAAVLLAEGADAIMLLGTTGEATSLTLDERVGVMRAVAARIDPAKLMIGTGAASVADAALLTRLAHDLGARSALILPPFFYRPLSPEGVIAALEAALAGVPEGLRRAHLYNIPQLTGVTYDADLARRAAERLGSGLLGVKDSSGDLGQSDALVAALPGRAVYPSSEEALAIATARGYAGIISGSVAADIPAARRLADGNPQAAPRVVAVRKRLQAAGLIPAVKAALAARFGDAAWGRVRAPLVALAPAAAATLAADLAVAGRG